MSNAGHPSGRDSANKGAGQWWTCPPNPDNPTAARTGEDRSAVIGFRRTILPPPSRFPDGSQRLAWYEFIAAHEVDWSWYGHLTFEHDADLWYARRAWFCFVAEVASWQTTWTAADLRTRHPVWLAAFERHRWRAALHVHFLMGEVERLDSFPGREHFFRHFWQDRFGLAKIDRFDPLRGGVAYILKLADDADDNWRQIFQIDAASELSSFRQS